MKSKIRYALYVGAILLGCYIFGICSGCEYQVDEVVSKHTNYSHEFSGNGITIEFLLEEEPLPYFSADDYLFAADALRQNVASGGAYKHIIVFIPASSDALKEIENFNYSVFASFTADTNLGDYIILINPDIYEYGCARFVDAFMHELLHAVLEERSGDPDTFHTRRDLWAAQKATSADVAEIICTD